MRSTLSADAAAAEERRSMRAMMGEQMHKYTGYCAILFVVLLSSGKTAAAGGPDAWTKAREVRGSFGIILGRTGSDVGASALIQTDMKGFIVQGTVVLKQVRASADSILFQGASKGFLFMQHRASVLGGQAATSEELCLGEFTNGEFIMEVFPREREYQVQFSGEVPACAITTQYPAFQRMAGLLTKWYEYQKLVDPWGPLVADMAAVRDEFASFSATGKNKETVTFSATAEPEIKKDAGTGFPIMHFYPLAAAGTRLQGSGNVQLTVSTSVFPLVMTTEAQWSLQAVP